MGNLYRVGMIFGVLGEKVRYLGCGYLISVHIVGAYNLLCAHGGMCTRDESFVVLIKWKSCGVEQLVRVVRASCDLDLTRG